MKNSPKKIQPRELLAVNRRFIFLPFLCGCVLMLLSFSSCSGSKRVVRQDNTTVKEYEDKLYNKTGNPTPTEKETDVSMPAPVDVSDYKPEWYKEDEALSEKETRFQMVEFGKEFLGVPYRYGGNSRQQGFDCSGLVCHVYARFGYRLPRTSRQQSREGRRIKLRHAQAGDLIFFGYRGKTNHVALVVERKGDDIYVLHSTSSKGVRIDNISQSSYWRKRIIQARRLF